MRRICATLFLGILLANSCGFYVYYVVQLRQIRSEMRHALKMKPDSELDVLTLTTANYEKAKVGDDEVKVDGRMYDIARIEFSSGSVKIFCLYDEKEDNLMALLSELISKPLKDRGAMPDSILQFISMVFLQPSENEFLWKKLAVDNTLTPYYFSLQESDLQYDSPPPWNS